MSVWELKSTKAGDGGGCNQEGEVRGSGGCAAFRYLYLLDSRVTHKPESDRTEPVLGEITCTVCDLDSFWVHGTG